jgi:hypothetical protein
MTNALEDTSLTMGTHHRLFLGGNASHLFPADSVSR